MASPLLLSTATWTKSSHRRTVALSSLQRTVHATTTSGAPSGCSWSFLLSLPEYPWVGPSPGEVRVDCTLWHLPARAQAPLQHSQELRLLATCLWKFLHPSNREEQQDALPRWSTKPLPGGAQGWQTEGLRSQLVSLTSRTRSAVSKAGDLTTPGRLTWTCS